MWIKQFWFNLRDRNYWVSEPASKCDDQANLQPESLKKRGEESSWQTTLGPASRGQAYDDKKTK